MGWIDLRKFKISFVFYVISQYRDGVGSWNHTSLKTKSVPWLLMSWWCKELGHWETGIDSRNIRVLVPGEQKSTWLTLCPFRNCACFAFLSLLCIYLFIYCFVGVWESHWYCDHFGGSLQPVVPAVPNILFKSLRYISKLGPKYPFSKWFRLCGHSISGNMLMHMYI